MSTEPTGTIDSMTNHLPMPQSPRECWPAHIAIIMDGNGRWANDRGESRVLGHREGAMSARAVIEHCRRLGIRALTLFSFSSENWKRPEEEVNALMALCCEHLAKEREHLIANGIRLRTIGRRQGMPANVLKVIDRTVAATAECTDMDLLLALNYGSRTELADIARELAELAVAGEIDPAQIDEQAVASRLQTAPVGDPDLVIRTGGELRVSNFLLWQISYAEFHVTDQAWPEFREVSLNSAIDAFADRSRRFGNAKNRPSD